MAVEAIHLVSKTPEKAADSDPEIVPYFAIEQFQTWIRKKELVTVWLRKTEPGREKFYTGRIIQYKDGWFTLATYTQENPRKIRVLNRDYVTMIEPV